MGLLRRRRGIVADYSEPVTLSAPIRAADVPPPPRIPSNAAQQMPTRRVDISAEPGRATVVLDGHDISAAVAGYTIRQRHSELAQVELELVVLDGHTDADPALVLIPQDTRDLLVSLGWTPPQGDR